MSTLINPITGLPESNATLPASVLSGIGAQATMTADSLISLAAGMTAVQAATFSVDIKPVNLLTPSTALELTVPVGTYPQGSVALYHIKPSADITLTMHSSIIIPSESTFTSMALETNKQYIVQLSRMDGFWMLVTIVGGGVLPS